MVKRNWKELDDRIESVFNYNTFVIDKNDFDYLLNLYKFKPIPKYHSFYDKKRRKVVAMINKNKLTNKYEIVFNKDWIFKEAVITKCNKVLEIMKQYNSCFDILCLYNKIIRNRIKNDRDLILKEYNNE